MGKTSTASKRKYNEKAYDRVSLTVKKGTKQILQEVAAKKGDSINGYIKKAVMSQYAADTGEDIKL